MQSSVSVPLNMVFSLPQDIQYAGFLSNHSIFTGCLLSQDFLFDPHKNANCIWNIKIPPTTFPPLARSTLKIQTCLHKLRIGGWAHIGAFWSILNTEVASFHFEASWIQGWPYLYWKAHIGTFRSVLNTGVVSIIAELTTYSTLLRFAGEGGEWA